MLNFLYHNIINDTLTLARLAIQIHETSDRGLIFLLPDNHLIAQTSIHNASLSKA